MTKNLICQFCKSDFIRSNKQIASSRCRKTKNSYCSNKCFAESQVKKLEFKCANCNSSVLKTPAEIRKSVSGRAFCSSSCAATLNNKNKKTGTKRSKLEIYLEAKIRESYPHIIILCNNKTAIGSELDFYFPELYFAIELNGIFHYEPIYGADKLSKIKNNDLQKSIACHEAGIELCIIDASSRKYLTNNEKEKYFSIAKSILDNIISRKTWLAT